VAADGVGAVPAVVISLKGSREPCLVVDPHVCHAGSVRAHVSNAIHSAVSRPARRARLRRQRGDPWVLEDVSHAWMAPRQAATLIQQPKPGHRSQWRDATQPDTCDNRAYDARNLVFSPG